MATEAEGYVTGASGGKVILRRTGRVGMSKNEIIWHAIIIIIIIIVININRLDDFRVTSILCASVWNTRRRRLPMCESRLANGWLIAPPPLPPDSRRQRGRVIKFVFSFGFSRNANCTVMPCERRRSSLVFISKSRRINQVSGHSGHGRVVHT